MKILLLTPGHTVKERYSSRFNIKSGALPSMGIGIIGTIVKSLGHDVKYLDMALDPYSDEELTVFIGSYRPDWVGISCTTPYAHKALRIAGVIKDAFRNTPVVFGGTHMTIFPEQSMNAAPAVDIGVIGEGEETVRDLLLYFEGKKPLEDIPGIVYRKNGGLAKTPGRQVIEDIDKLPFIDREIFDLKRYVPLPNQYRRLPLMHMITSRGCPYRCAFCFEGGKFGHKHRRQSPQRVIDEMSNLLEKYGIREFSFWDDNFLLPRQWVVEFCRLIKEKKMDIVWSCYSRVNDVSPEILRTIRDAGCYNIFYGLESGVQKLLDNLNKRTTVEQNRKAVQWANEAGLEVRGSFMLAIPGETPALGRQTIRFILSLTLHSLQISYTTPYPGTALYELCRKSGRLQEKMEEYSTFKVVYVPEGYASAAEVYRLQKTAYRKFYFRPSYMIMQARKIKRLSDVKRLLDGAVFALGITV